MSSDILGMYESSAERVGGVTNHSGGVKEAKPLRYSPPVGPKGQMESGPGLHGDNCGNCGTQED